MFSHISKQIPIKQDEYPKISKLWETALASLRVPSIRKYLKFSAEPFETYEAETSGEESPLELSPDVDSIPLTLKADFPYEEFPKFSEEYLSPFDYLTTKQYQTRDGLKLLHNPNYHSLTLAAFEIDKEIKKRFPSIKGQLKGIDSIVSLASFAVPFQMTSAPKMRIYITVIMIKP